MRDGVEIAVTVDLPADLKEGERVPVLMRTTRYWRPSFQPRRKPGIGRGRCRKIDALPRSDGQAQVRTPIIPQ